MNAILRRRPSPPRPWAAALAGALALVPAPAAAQGAGYLRAHYRKEEVRIPMRDGVRLFTAIYVPRGGPGPFPILLHRTPYGVGPYGPGAYPEDLGPDEELAREGYVFAYQDVRGKRMSGGTFQEMTPLKDGAGVDEATDAWDTIDWLCRNVPGNSGRVGVWGISYPGFYAACALVGAHPALKAVSPQAPMADLFAGDDDHHNGALFLAQTFWFDAYHGWPRPGPAAEDPRPASFPEPADGYRFFLELGALRHADERYFQGRVRVWSDEMAHGDRDGYWRARDLRPHLRDVRPAVLTVGGWFDAEDLFGTLQVDRRLDQAAQAPHHLVMGPWDHGGWADEGGDRLGAVTFGSRTARTFQSRVEAPFFRHWLKDGPDPALPRALVFETGRNAWRSFDAWPPRAARPTALYFQAGGGLGYRRPPGPAEPDRFRSDPARPVPYTAAAEPQVSPEFMVADQRFAAARPDVLTYRTAPLKRPLTLAGPIQVRLQVSTTGTDADWVVKVIDEYPEPDGTQQLVRGDVMRGKYRASLAHPRPFVPGRPTRVQFTLNDICHTFRPGHRLMVQVQSSWFPLVDRNPQVFTDIYRARDEDFQAQEHALYRDATHPSCLVLPVLP